MKMTREELAKGMLEMKKMEERMKTDPEYRAKMEQERKEYEAMAERMEKQPRRITIGKKRSIVSRISICTWQGMKTGLN